MDKWDWVKEGKEEEIETEEKSEDDRKGCDRLCSL